MQTAISIPSQYQRVLPAGQVRLGSWRLNLALIGGFFVLGLLLTFHSLAYPWSWDDLHLVHPFSPSELVQGLTGTWDIDHIETPGYRPGTVLFNEARSVLLGDNVVAQRVLVLGIFAVYLTMLARLAARIGTPTWVAAVGCSLALITRDNWWNLVWPTDGPRVLACMLGLTALYLFTSALLCPARWKLPACVALAAIAVFTREEPLALFPLMLLLAPVAVLVNQGGVSASKIVRPWLLGSLGLVGVAAVWFAARSWVIVTSALAADPASLRGWTRDFLVVLYPMGLPNPMSIIQDPVHIAWTVMLAALALAAVRLVSKPARLRVVLWLFCAFVTCAPGVFGPRPNILVLPIGFASLAFAEILGELLLRSRPIRLLGAMALLFVCFAAANESERAQQQLNPLSLARLQNDEMMVYGRYSKMATIPPDRRRAVEAELAPYGIYSDADFLRIWPSLRESALRSNLRAPNAEGQPFAPPVGMMSP